MVHIFLAVEKDRPNVMDLISDCDLREPDITRGRASSNLSGQKKLHIDAKTNTAD